MFEYIRNHQRLMQFLLMLIILPSFAMFGLSSFTSMREGDNVVAKVGDLKVTQQEWDAEVRDGSPAAKMNVLDNLIARRALMVEARRINLAVTDQKLQKEISSMQGMTTADGRFDKDNYEAFLKYQNLTSLQHQAQIRQNLSMQQLAMAVQASGFAPREVAKRLSDMNDQERSAQEMLFKSADFLKQAKVTDDMLKTYYNQNIRQFEIPEQVKAEYVVLSADALAADIAVPDADVKAYYDQNTKRYSVEEQRRASHILITVKKDAPAADKAAAKAKAEKLLEQVRKNPADFAKLAKENSQDPGSAARGGDLDFFGKGMMVKPFEDTTFKLKQGEISDLVESQFGYHIIQLTAVKPASVKTLDEVKGEISNEIKKQLASKKYSELAELFRNTAEENDSLKAVVDKLASKVKLTIEVAANLTRQPNPSTAPTAPYNNPKFLTALFADDAIKNKRNTEAVETAPNTMVTAHVLEFKAAARRPFEEVRAMLLDGVTQTEAKKLAKKAGETKLAELKAKDDATGFGEVKTISRTKSEGIEKFAVAAVMKADVNKLPTYVGVEIPGQGYGIYRLSKVAQPATVDTARRDAELQQLTGSLSQQEMVEYIEMLKQKANVKILKSAPTATADTQNPTEPDSK